MNYYFQKNYFSIFSDKYKIFSDEYKAELTEDKLILSKVSTNEEVELSKIKYQTIYKINLRKLYITQRRGYWQYSCIIHSNYTTPITIFCPLSGYKRRNYLVFVNYLHTCCSSVNHIDYTFYDESQIAQIGLNWYGFIYVVFSSIIIMGLRFVAANPDYITLFSIIITLALPYLINPLLKDIGQENAYGIYQNDKILENILP
jgi:hypothetical protein